MSIFHGCSKPPKFLFFALLLELLFNEKKNMSFRSSANSKSTHSEHSRRKHNAPDGACGGAWYSQQQPMLQNLQAYADQVDSDGGSACGAKPFVVAWGFKDRPGYMYGFYNNIDTFYLNTLRVPAGERRGYPLTVWICSRTPSLDVSDSRKAMGSGGRTSSPRGTWWPV